MDIFLMLGLIVVVLLSLLVYLIDAFINRKKPNKKDYTFFKRYPPILIKLLIVFAIIYLMKVSAFIRIVYGIIIISLPLAGLIYYIRSLDKNIVKRRFAFTYFAVLLAAAGALMVLMVYMYNADYKEILEAKKPTFAMKNGIFAYEKQAVEQIYMMALSIE